MHGQLNTNNLVDVNSIMIIIISNLNISANSRLTLLTTGGPSKANDEYNCTRLAPDNILSYASCPDDTPPTPIIGNNPVQKFN